MGMPVTADTTLIELFGPARGSVRGVVRVVGFRGKADPRHKVYKTYTQRALRLLASQDRDVFDDFSSTRCTSLYTRPSDHSDIWLVYPILNPYS